MDHKQRLQEIHDFLKPYQRIWQNEIMLLYPEPLKDFPKAWIDELSQFKNKDDVIRLERKDVFPFIKNTSLIEFYTRIEQLCQVTPLPSLPAFPELKNSFLHMIPKKQHEIKKLVPYVESFFKQHQIQKIIDIGGGVGHLAQSLTLHYGLPTVSLDLDPVMQKTGKERNPNSQTEYVNVKVDVNEKIFTDILSKNSMTLGLHTCGPLANHQIQASSTEKIRGIISFGCCYEKLQRDPHSQNTSQFAKNLSDPIHLSYFALTLATRAHKKMDEKDYLLKMKVKFYRYAIHILLFEKYEMKELVTLGNSSPGLYDYSFSHYVTQQASRIGLKLNHTPEELDQFYADPTLQELVWKMITAGLIRNAFGRLLELYLLLDRVLYLEEKGYEVQLLEFFNESVSPRNLGICAHL